MSAELKQEGQIVLDEMLGESIRHVVTRLSSGTVVDSYTSLQGKPQQKNKNEILESGTLDYGLSRFAAGINEQRRRFRRHRR